MQKSVTCMREATICSGINRVSFTLAGISITSLRTYRNTLSPVPVFYFKKRKKLCWPCQPNSSQCYVPQVEVLHVLFSLQALTLVDRLAFRGVNPCSLSRRRKSQVGEAQAADNSTDRLQQRVLARRHAETGNYFPIRTRTAYPDEPPEPSMQKNNTTQASEMQVTDTCMNWVQLCLVLARGA